jgi:hypothetical protein
LLLFLSVDEGEFCIVPPKEEDWRIIVVRLNPPDNSVVDATIFVKKLCAHRRMTKKRSFSPLLFKRASDSPRDKLVRTCSCRFKPNVEKLSSLLLKNVSLFCEFFHTKFFLSFSSSSSSFFFFFSVSFGRKQPTAEPTRTKKAERQLHFIQNFPQQ